MVARALHALIAGVGDERRIYMSPIASDHDFDARLVGDALVVTLEGAPPATLSCDDIRALAGALEDAAGAGVDA